MPKKLKKDSPFPAKLTDHDLAVLGLQRRKQVDRDLETVIDEMSHLKKSIAEEPGLLYVEKHQLKVVITAIQRLGKGILDTRKRMKLK